MVAKMPLSNRRLITSLARTPSFSESSLMATPSVIVILRVVGISSSGTGLGASGGGMPGRTLERGHGSRHRWPYGWNATRSESAGRRASYRSGGSGMHWPWFAGPPEKGGAHRRGLGPYGVRVDRLAGRGVAAHLSRGSRWFAVRDGTCRQVRDLGSLKRDRWSFPRYAGTRHGNRRHFRSDLHCRPCGRRR